jgi:hypothetical protein
MKSTITSIIFQSVIILLLTLLYISCQKKDVTVPSSTSKDSIIDTPKKEVEKEEFETVDSAYSDKMLKVDSTDLQEANTSFTFKGSPIDPMFVKSFVPWVSDPIPSYMALDVMASKDANLFYTSEDVHINEDGYVVVRNRENFNDSFDIYRYKWLGMLNNKIHVLKYVEENETASGVFINLVFVQFELSSYSYNGVPYTQLLMKNKGGLAIGDRTSSEVILNKKKNRLTLKTLDYGSNEWVTEQVQL